MATIVVTGAGGFIGARLSTLLAAHGHLVRATVRDRSDRGPTPPGIQVFSLGDLASQPHWSPILQGSDCIVHLAGRAHIMRESMAGADAAFHRINVQATLELFRASERAGVRRFVFVSSIGVLGVASGGQPFSATSVPRPAEAYAVSKWRAELELAACASSSPTELVIVRPTLVCGAGAKGNFERLVRLVKRGLPLPLASVRGLRNFVGLDNLCDLLESCCTHPGAAGQTFLAADQETYTTPQLICAIAAALSLKARLLPCPPALLRLAGRALNRRAEVDRLIGSLLVDASVARATLGWRSARPLKEEITAMAQAVREP